MAKASARERLLAAIDGAPGAPVPCCFMLFRALREQCRDEHEFALRQAEMGLDVRVRLEDVPMRLAPEVEVDDWVEPASDGGPPRLNRRYETPAGPLTAAVKLTEDWPFGERLPLFGDYITPRAVKYLVTGPEDLEPLRYLIRPPAAGDRDSFFRAAEERRRFAQEHGLLVAGGWRPDRSAPGEDRYLVGDNSGTGTVVDALMWLCGATEPLMWAYDEPDFLSDLIGLMETWNRERVEMDLEAGAELVIRRAWYEGTDFWSPRFYREFILQGVRREAELIHGSGTRYGYIITSGMVPLAESLLESGVDVIVGVDPGEGKGTTLDEVRRAFGGKIGLWGGVSGPLSVEQGSEREVRRAVEEAMSAFAPTRRFILSPVDNIRVDDEQTRRNVRAFIETWRGLAGE